MNQLEEINIENLIYNIRGKQVMLDRDLAKLYQCKNGTKSINLAITRNKDRFPDDFCFQLTNEEYRNLKFQVETSNSNSINKLEDEVVIKLLLEKISNIIY